MGHAREQRAQRLELVGLHELSLRLLESLQVVTKLGVDANLVERDPQVMGEAREHAPVLVPETARLPMAGDEDTDRSLLGAEPRHEYRAHTEGVEPARAGDAPVPCDVLDFHRLLAVEGGLRDELDGGGRLRDVGRPAHRGGQP